MMYQLSCIILFKPQQVVAHGMQPGAQEPSGRGVYCAQVVGAFTGEDKTETPADSGLGADRTFDNRVLSGVTPKVRCQLEEGGACARQ